MGRRQRERRLGKFEDEWKTREREECKEKGKSSVKENPFRSTASRRPGSGKEEEEW